MRNLFAIIKSLLCAVLGIHNYDDCYEAQDAAGAARDGVCDCCMDTNCPYSIFGGNWYE